MSNLLINEPPLQVLPTLATRIGLNEAIILQQIHFLASYGKEADGEKWVVKTAKEWAEIFPFWSDPTIRRAMSNLRKTGLVATGNFNKANYDKTIWWRVDYAVLGAFEGKAYDQNDHRGYDQNDHRAYDQTDHIIRSDQIDQTNTIRKNKLEEEEKETLSETQSPVILASGPAFFTPPQGLAVKGKQYAALVQEPTLRDRAIVAAQGLGMTHFTGTFKKRAEKLGRKLDDRDWQAILDWCAYLDTKIGVWDGKRTVQVQDVTSWLVAAIRDAEPVPPMPEVDPEPEALPETPWMALENDDPMNLKDENHAQAAEVEPIDPNDPLVVAWEKVKGELKLQMTEGTFQTWVADTRLVSLEVDEKTGGRAVISYPNKYGVEWLSKRLYATIRRTLGGIYKISFTVQFQEVGA